MEAPRKFRIQHWKIREKQKIRFPPVLLYHGSGLTWESRCCHWKSGTPDSDRARAGKPVFPFCPIVAQPRHLQTSTGYLRIGLDLRIPTVPKNPDFRFWIGRKLRKNWKIQKLHVTYQIKANGTMVHADTLKCQNSCKIRTKPEFFFIFIVLQKAIRSIGRSPASTFKLSLFSVKKASSVTSFECFHDNCETFLKS